MGGFGVAAAAGVADAGGGAPLGEDLGLGAEEVADGGVEALDERAAFLDEGAGLGGVADVGGLIVGLFAAFAGDVAEMLDCKALSSQARDFCCWSCGGRREAESAASMNR